MFHHVLVATDGSALANKGLGYGASIAKRDQAKLTVVTVTPQWSALDIAHDVRQGQPDPIAQYEQLAAAGANRLLADAVVRCKNEGVACTTVHVKDQHPAEGIVATARDLGCDLIVMASHGRRGIARMTLGSQTNDVLAHSSVPVLVVR